MNVERIIWVAVVLITGLIAQNRGRMQAVTVTPSAASPVALSAEVRAYVDQKLGARDVASVNADCASRARKIEGRLAEVEQTNALRAAAQAKCTEVTKEFRHLFEEQVTVASMLRDQEIGRLRNIAASTCADAPAVGGAPKKRGLFK